MVQIICAFGLLISAIIAVWQYWLNRQTEKERYIFEKKAQAIKLSEYYKDNILKDYVAIKYVLEKSGLLQILEKIDKQKMQNFDCAELNTLLSVSDQKTLDEIKNSKKFVKTLIEANEAYDLGFDNCGLKINLDDDTNNNIESNPIYIRITRQFMSGKVQRTLNNMEFFAMHFDKNHEIADENVVFPSLHQTYLEMIQMLYWVIAKQNDKPHAKFYTNVIRLYQLWYNKRKDIDDTVLKTERSCCNTGAESK